MTDLNVSEVVWVQFFHDQSCVFVCSVFNVRQIISRSAECNYL